MIITKEMFEDYKKNVKQGDCLVYAEAKDGKFMNAMVGETHDIMVAFCCLLERYSESNDMSPLEVIADIQAMLQTYEDTKNQEGGDR